MKHVVLLVLISALTEAKLEKVTVRGALICDGKRMKNVLVELWEKDTVSSDDLLDSVLTKENGEFTVKGEQDEMLTSIEPFIRITHNCRANPGCSRIMEITVPKTKINGEYDIGSL